MEDTLNTPASASQFALFFIDDSGVRWFAGTFRTRDEAMAKANANGKPFAIEEVVFT